MLYIESKSLLTAFTLFLFLCFPPLIGLPAQQAEYSGTLDTELVPDLYALGVAELEPASAEEKSQLPIRLSLQDQAFVGKLHSWQAPTARVLGYLVPPLCLGNSKFERGLYKVPIARIRNLRFK